MNRRGFLGLLGTTAAVTAAGIAVPELFVPGKTAFFLPPPGGWRDRLVVRKIEWVNNDFRETRYDATWYGPKGHSQYHVDVADIRIDVDEHGIDALARKVLEDRMDFDEAFPNSPKFKLALPRGVAKGKYV